MLIFPSKEPYLKEKEVFLNITITILTMLFCLMFLQENTVAQLSVVTVNLRFVPVQTIAVQATQKTTHLIYAVPEDYENGVSVIHDNHLTIFSSGGFQVTVAADNQYFRRVGGGGETIPVEDLVIKATSGSSNGSQTQFKEATLSVIPAPIIESEKGGRNLNFNITYDNSLAGSAQKYIDKYIKDDEKETVYATNVIYTILTR